MTYPRELREIALVNEMDLAIHLIKEGLASIQKIPGSSFGGPDYHVPILLISSGFERYCKCMIIVNYLTDEGRLPNDSEVNVRNYSHQLDLLIGELVSGYKPDLQPLKQDPADLNFIKNDPLASNVIEILSGFGEGGRYNYLDIVLGKTPDIERIPEVAFDTFEAMLVESDSDLVELQSDSLKQSEFVSLLNIKVVALIEKMAKNLGKLMRYNSDTGAKVFTLVSTFILTAETALGRVDYSK